jgi:hypothetical protein
VLKVVQLSYDATPGLLDFGGADLLQLLTGWSPVQSPLSMSFPYVPVVKSALVDPVIDRPIVSMMSWWFTHTAIVGGGSHTHTHTVVIERARLRCRDQCELLQYMLELPQERYQPEYENVDPMADTASEAARAGDASTSVDPAPGQRCM